MSDKKSPELELPEAQIVDFISKIREETHRELALHTPEFGQVHSHAMSKESDIDWIEEPASFAEFVNDPYHLGQPPLSPRQRRDVEEFIGTDPKKLFSSRPEDIEENMYSLAVLMWGKGSGKDWLCTMIQPYLVHVLLCMKDVHQVVGLAPNENIDIINVAFSAKQANEIYFTKFLQRIHNWPWLKDRFPIVHQGRVLNKDQHPEVKLRPDGQNYVRIGTGRVMFPHMIRAISEHSENESYEGYNVLFWVMDEAAAFRSKGKKGNAHKVFGTLRTSAMSRFPRLWRGMMISYPRSQDDFMMQMYNKGLSDPRTFTSKGYTWQVNPTKRKSDFDSEFERYPTESRSKYMCDPPPRQGAAFDPQKVDAAINFDRQSLVKTQVGMIVDTLYEPTTKKTYHMKCVGKVVMEIVVNDLRERSTPRVFHVDGGLTNCSAGLVIAHAEPVIYGGEALNKIVVDTVLRWTPVPDSKVQVSLNNIAAVIQMIAEKTNIVYGTYDQWNSQSSLEALFMAGIPVEKHNIDAEDYSLLETLFNIHCIDIPGDEYSDYVQITDEIKNLVRLSTGTGYRYGLPTDEQGSDDTGAPIYTKDLADCLAGCARALSMIDLRASITGTHAPKPLVGPSISSTGGQPFNVHTMANAKGGVPNKVPQSSFPESSGFVGEKMSESHEITKQHALLTEVGGDIRLKGVHKPTLPNPPSPIIMKK